MITDCYMLIILELFFCFQVGNFLLAFQDPCFPPVSLFNFLKPYLGMDIPINSAVSKGIV